MASVSAAVMAERFGPVEAKVLVKPVWNNERNNHLLQQYWLCGCCGLRDEAIVMGIANVR